MRVGLLCGLTYLSRVIGSVQLEYHPAVLADLFTFYGDTRYFYFQAFERLVQTANSLIDQLDLDQRIAILSGCASLATTVLEEGIRDTLRPIYQVTILQAKEIPEVRRVDVLWSCCVLGFDITAELGDLEADLSAEPQ